MEANSPTTQPDLESLWVENATNVIHTVKFVQDHVLARALAPALYSIIRRFETAKFADLFHEYSGNYEEVRGILDGGERIVAIKND